MKLGSEFFAWARENGLPPRAPMGSPENKVRQYKYYELRRRWTQLQKEKEVTSEATQSKPQ